MRWAMRSPKPFSVGFFVSVQRGAGHEERRDKTVARLINQSSYARREKSERARGRWAKGEELRDFQLFYRLIIRESFSSAQRDSFAD